MKACSECQQTKAEAEFSSDKRNKTGLKSPCKVCCAARTRRYYWKHIRERTKYNREYYHKNRDKWLVYIKPTKNEMAEYSHKHTCGSEKKYNEAMLKYDGWCAFACDRKAYLVHHMDGKNIFNSPEQEVNNNLTNLLPLCNSCHGWLHKKTSDGRNAVRF